MPGNFLLNRTAAAIVGAAAWLLGDRMVRATHNTSPDEDLFEMDCTYLSEDQWAYAQLRMRDTSMQGRVTPS